MSTTTTTKRSKAVDGYEFVTGYEERLLDEILEMEADSEWIHDIKTKELRLIPAEYPVYAEATADEYGLDYEDVFDTMQEDGTRQLVHDCWNDQVWCLASTGITAVNDRAKLFGSALGRMAPNAFAVCINNAFEVARDGATLGYVVNNRMASMHAENTYEIMQISHLFQTAKEQLEKDFGYARFISGTNRLDMTLCEWALPEMQESIVSAYEQAIRDNGIDTNFDIEGLMPVVRFQTSNTSNSSAFLFPMFRMKDGSYLRMVDPVGVKHEQRKNISGEELFAQEAGGLYPKFFETANTVRELADIVVYHGPNCVVNLCKRYGIPKKYGEDARAMVESFTSGGIDPISAHEIYLAISQAVGKARFGKAGTSLVLQMEDSVARILRADWSEHDVGGTATWGNK